MRKIASPQDLQAEIQSIMAQCQGEERPSRRKLAAKLNALADRVAGTERTAKLAPWAQNVYPRDFGILKKPAEEAFDTTSSLYLAVTNLLAAGDLEDDEKKALKKLGDQLGKVQNAMDEAVYQIRRLT